MSENRVSAIGSLLPARKPGQRWWQRLFIYPTFIGALLGAIPTGIDLYKSFEYDIGFNDVQHAEEQRRLWIKNFDCAQAMKYQKVETGEGVMVQVGACSNGDVLIEVSSPDSKRILEWVSLQRLRSEASLAWLPLIGTAHAATGEHTARSQRSGALIRSAQADSNVLCQVIIDKTMLIRIVRENGACYREEIEVMKGTVASRKPVSCDASCR